MTMGEATRKDELLAAIQSSDEQQCIRLLKGLDETARRALHPSVAKAVEEIRSAHDKFPFDREISERLMVARFSRWSRQLGRVAQAGAKQANAIFHAIEALFASGNGKEASDYGKLVGLERELAHQTGLRLTLPEAISGLKSSSVRGKTMRTITELLKL